MIYVVTFIIFIILLSVLIIVHEFGHMYVAQKRGVIVQSFAIGFGKKIYSFKKNGVEYRINILPFGGYVSLLGENDFSDKTPGSIGAASPFSKFLIVIAGVFMNFVLALILLFIFLVTINFKFYYSNIVPNFNFAFGKSSDQIMFQGIPTDKTSSVVKDHLNKVYLLNTINNQKISSVSQVENIVRKDKGKFVDFKFETVKNLSLYGISLGSIQNKKFFVRSIYPKNSGPIGIALNSVSHLGFSSISSKITSFITFPYDLLQLTFSGLGYFIHQAIVHNNSKIITTQVAGPVGIYMYTNIIYQNDGFVGILFIFGIISLSLSIMNLLPIPPLDGFYVLLSILEGIFKVKISEKLLYYFSLIGITFFVILMILVTLNDLINFHII